jgi:hypothetical protein
VQRRVEVHLILGRACDSRGGAQLLVVRGFDAGDAALVAAHGQQHRVHGEAVQPRGEGALTAKAVHTFPQAHEDILHCLLGTGTFSRQAQAQRQHASRVAPVQDLERQHVAACSAACQLAVVRRARLVIPARGIVCGRVSQNGSLQCRYPMLW